MSLKDILVVLGELSSFLSLLRMASGLTQAVSHSEQRRAISKIGNGESRNGERGTGNGERGTGNGEWGTGNL